MNLRNFQPKVSEFDKYVSFGDEGERCDGVPVQ